MCDHAPEFWMMGCVCVEVAFIISRPENLNLSIYSPPVLTSTPRQRGLGSEDLEERTAEDGAWVAEWVPDPLPPPTPQPTSLCLPTCIVWQRTRNTSTPLLWAPHNQGGSPTLTNTAYVKSFHKKSNTMEVQLRNTRRQKTWLAFPCKAYIFASARKPPHSILSLPLHGQVDISLLSSYIRLKLPTAHQYSPPEGDLVSTGIQAQSPNCTRLWGSLGWADRGHPTPGSHPPLIESFSCLRFRVSQPWVHCVAFSNSQVIWFFSPHFLTSTFLFRSYRMYSSFPKCNIFKFILFEFHFMQSLQCIQ